MKVLRNIGVITLATAAAIGMTACEQQLGPAESAGKSMGQATDNVDRKITATTDKVATNVENQGSQAGIAMGDTEITTRVKAAIFAEPGLKTLQISVDTVQGVVALSGSTDSPANSERAASLAAAVAGVKQVDNQLVAMAR